jgi:hypothetical protein
MACDESTLSVGKSNMFSKRTSGRKALYDTCALSMGLLNYEGRNMMMRMG